MSRDAERLAQLVRARREAMHLTQEQLAERVGVSRSEISEIEAGRVRHPRTPVFTRLGRTLGLPASALLAAVGYAASEMAGVPEAVDAEGAEELLILGAMLAHMTAGDRSWLRERLRELQELATRRTRSRARGRRA